MAVAVACTEDDEYSIDQSALAGLPAQLHELVRCGVLASQREPFDPMEAALHQLGQRFPSATMNLDRYKLVREYPLSPQLLAVCRAYQLAPAGDQLVTAKGAPEAIGTLCRLSGEAVKELRARVDALAAKGLRVLAVARATHARGPLPEQQQDFAFTLLGLLAFSDPIRPEVPAAVAACYSAGVRVLMITGDYPSTARSIVEQSGITPSDAVITGAEMASMEGAELVRRVQDVNVFAPHGAGTKAASGQRSFVSR